MQLNWHCLEVSFYAGETDHEEHAENHCCARPEMSGCEVGVNAGFAGSLVALL